MHHHLQHHHLHHQFFRYRICPRYISVLSKDLIKLTFPQLSSATSDSYSYANEQSRYRYSRSAKTLSTMLSYEDIEIPSHFFDAPRSAPLPPPSNRSQRDRQSQYSFSDMNHHIQPRSASSLSEPSHRSYFEEVVVGSRLPEWWQRRRDIGC